MTSESKFGRGGLQHEYEHSSEYILTYNDALLRLKSFIERVPPNWRLLKGQDAKILKGTDGSVVGPVYEAYVDSVINFYAQNRTGVVLDPIPDEKQAGPFRFKNMSKSPSTSVYVYRPSTETQNGHWVARGEYDRLLLVDNLPVVVEVKTGSEKNLENIDKALSPAAIDFALDPLKECFERTTFGYVLVTNPEGVTGSTEQQKFLDRGGLLCATPISSTQFTDDVFANMWIFE